MTRRLTQVLQAWERGGKNQGQSFSRSATFRLLKPFWFTAHDAKMLLTLPLEEAADWIDEHLPLPPNADSLTGAEIPLPPSPRSTPTLASVPLQSPPRISFSLPDARARRNSGRSAGGEKQGQVDEIVKVRNEAALIVSTSVKDAQSLAHLPSPPPTAELAATASFSSALHNLSPPPEKAELPSSPAQQSVPSSSLGGTLVTKNSVRRRRSSNSRSPRIPNADFAKPSLIRSPSRTRSPQRLSSPRSRPRAIRRSLSPPIPPHPGRHSRPRFRSPPPPRPHRRVQSRSPSPRRATRRFTPPGRPRNRSLSPRRPRGRSPSPSFARQRSSSPRFERKRSSTPRFRIGEPLRYEISSGLRPVIRQVQSSLW